MTAQFGEFKTMDGKAKADLVLNNQFRLAKSKEDLEEKLRAIVKDPKEVIDRMPADYKHWDLQSFFPDDEEAVDLLSKMLDLNPMTRYTAEQCLQHSYFKDFNPQWRIQRGGFRYFKNFQPTTIEEAAAMVDTELTEERVNAGIKEFVDYFSYVRSKIRGDSPTGLIDI